MPVPNLLVSGSNGHIRHNAVARVHYSIHQNRRQLLGENPGAVCREASCMLQWRRGPVATAVRRAAYARPAYARRRVRRPPHPGHPLPV
jgi:hypothetical protein